MKKSLILVVLLSFVFNSITAQRIPTSKETFTNLNELTKILADYQDVIRKGTVAEQTKFITSNSNKITTLYTPAMLELEKLQTLIKNMGKASYDGQMYEMLTKNGTSAATISALKNAGGFYNIMILNAKNEINGAVLEINNSVKIIALKENSKEVYTNVNYYASRKLRCLVHVAAAAACAAIEQVGCAIGQAASAIVCFSSKS